MRKLYLQIYLTVLGVVVLIGVTLPVVWMLLPQNEPHQRTLRGVARLLTEFLPEGQDTGELQGAVEALSERLDIELSVRSPDGALLAAVGEAAATADRRQLERGWVRERGRRSSVALELPDGRWLVLSPDPRGHRGSSFLLGVAVLCGVAALGAYPVVRRLTRRLERLQRQVDELGAGEFSTRVEVQGNDEVAELARSFNRAAGRIERLVDAQRSTLASASHELRSPLARIRVAIELLTDTDRDELRAQVSEDIAELDELIEELLLASRLDAGDALGTIEEVDLLALVAEEAARTGAEVRGDAVSIAGDRRLLRRLVRNLLENARRHGGGSAVHAWVESGGEHSVCIGVADRGPGVPEVERERIFEPFYRPPGTREGDGGVGLGLSLVRRIARHFHGDAKCVAREGGGTEFRVTLSTESRA